jgi:hypothetical protein
MAVLRLYIGVRNGKTRTLLSKDTGTRKVIFHNEGPGQLTVTFDSAKLLGESSISVDPGKHRVLTTTGTGEVKYTATIAGATPEDPIIIID